MPRVSYLMPDYQRDVYDLLLGRYGETLSVADVCDFLGQVNRNGAKAWLDGVRGFTVNGRAKYLAIDIAKKVYEERL